ncbi:MAG: glutamine--fructose-6-phosphate transaminase (isomerizing) [Candidatus Omnitrophica bacterium]|nr:glutamine--fructose-6-phosphate transaminase (isomerizing) [Candidatus Omnitrophota bacterium]
MCGIVGYIGSRKIDTVLLKALSRLEYRGYDSAGLATVNQGTLSILKEPGKLTRLVMRVKENPVAGTLGIGHTRWATHGEPSERNAHPHSDCTNTVAIVHNGIIENHDTLKSHLIREGHKFTSDTDTEVLAHLIERFHVIQGCGLEESVRRTIGEIKGSYAFCVVSSREENVFIAARNGSPLVVGLGNGENFVASDAPAIVDFTRNAVFLEDYQMAVVSRDEVKITSNAGERIREKVVRIDWDAKDVSKEGFEHFMLKEIEEQPAVIDRLFRMRFENGGEPKLFDVLRFDVSQLKKVERVVIQACGTSWHAALTGKFFFESLSGIPAEVDVSSEFRYRKLIPQKKELLLSITQSGETIDTLMGLRHAKQSGFKALSICNVLGSTVTRESDAVIYTHAGPEIGVASTKAYTAQLGVLFALSLWWARERGSVNEGTYRRLADEFRELPDKMRKIISAKDRVLEIAEKYFQARDFLFLARGINYPNAHEGALKIKEIAYIHATGHPAGEMKHGPIALIDENMPVVAIMPESSVYEKMVSNIQEVKARSGKLIVVTTEGNTAIERLADDVIYIPETSEFLSPFLSVLPLQYLAYYVATLRGTDVDQPRNLAKSVTVE